jgi:serine/threonine-protein kinase
VEPRAFGKYTLLHRIARGGMADLYLARSSEVAGIERLLVIKLVAARYSQDPSFISMFEDEVRIVASLNHPNIGQVIDVGRQDGTYFLAMEYIHGRDLRQVLRRCMERGSPVPVSTAVPVVVRICAALQHAHQARGLDGQPLNIVHRDVSPSNIMITYEGQVKLVDFGIAKAANRTALTVPGTIKGKLRYLSPEQVSGQPVDARTDIFCVGVCLWETTVGRHCFEGASDAHIYHSILKGEVRAPSSLLPGYPPELERIVLKALSLRPEDRQQSAQALQQELERFAASTGIALSDLALSRFMRKAFEEELADLELARQQGRSLMQHLQEVARRAEKQMEHVVLVSGPGGGGDTPASGTTRAPPLQTLPPGGGQPREAPAPAASRRTVLYGEPVVASPSRAAPLATGSSAVSAAGLPVSASQLLEVQAAGQEQLLPGLPGEPGERRTVVVDAASLAEDDPPAAVAAARGLRF